MADLESVVSIMWRVTLCGKGVDFFCYWGRGGPYKMTSKAENNKFSF